MPQVRSRTSTPYLAGHPALADANFPAAVSSANLTSDGMVTSVPWVADTRVLFYRTDILAEAGLAGPPDHLGGVHGRGKKLRRAASGDYGYYIPQWDAPLPIEFAWQAGAEVVAPDGTITLDTPEFRKAVDFYLSLSEQKSVPTASDFDQTAGLHLGRRADAHLRPLPRRRGQGAGSRARRQVGRHDPAHRTCQAPRSSRVPTWASGRAPTTSMAAWRCWTSSPRPATQVAWFTATSELPTVNLAARSRSGSSPPTPTSRCTARSSRTHGSCPSSRRGTRRAPAGS